VPRVAFFLAARNLFSQKVGAVKPGPVETTEMADALFLKKEQ